MNVEVFMERHIDVKEDDPFALTSGIPNGLQFHTSRQHVNNHVPCKADSPHARRHP